MTVAELKVRPNPSAPPADLAPKERALWRRLVDEYQLADGPAIVLLEQLCRNLQLARECREIIEVEGKLVSGKEHPLLRVWRDADKVAHQALRSLNFDLEPLKAIGRPPGGRRAY
jgi:hypothetical protein